MHKKARQGKTENFTSLWFGLRRKVRRNFLKKNKICSLESNVLGLGLDMDNILFQTLKTSTIKKKTYSLKIPSNTNKNCQIGSK